MAIEQIKVLGQSSPPALSLTDLYAVPAGRMATVSSLTFCNRGAAEVRARVSVAPAGAADSPEQYLYYDLPVPPNDTFIATVGISLDAADVLRVYSDLATVSFQAFGAELTP